MSENGISVYVANLGLYNDGFDRGAWVDLPVSSEELNSILKDKVGVGDGEYEEYAIHDYDYSGALEAMGFKPGRFESVETLNDLAWIVDGMSEFDISAIAAAVEVSGAGDALELANLAMQSDDIAFSSYSSYNDSWSNEEKLGRSVLDGDEFGELMKNRGLTHCFDYEKHGEELIAEAYYAFDKGYLDASQSLPELDAFSRREISAFAAEKAAEKTSAIEKTTAKSILSSKFSRAKEASERKEIERGAARSFASSIQR